MIMRFADDFVCAFQYHDDMKRFYNVLDKRLGKFMLELSPEKTSVIRFSRFRTGKESELFTFLGFEYRWGLSRTGKPLVKMRTSKMKLQIALANIRKWIRAERNKHKTAIIMKKLRQKLLGHWNYYGVSGNIRMLRLYYFQVCRIVFKWLNRRSQRKSCNWHGFSEMLKHFQIPEPRIVGYWNWLCFYTKRIIPKSLVR